MVDNRFEVQACAGIGGMSTVYRARDRHTDRLVALKVLRDGSDNTIARFGHEARVLAGLDHPHIVRYVAHGLASSGEPYLVMEWLEGEELGESLRRERMKLSEAIALGLRISHALGAAHLRGVVHRDIKPSNIFLVDRAVDQVKVLDFGIARVHGHSMMTQTGSVLGTPGYMAPEQARGERGRVDARADVFSLGCVLYECITGQAAFTGGHLMAVLAKVLFEEVRRPREICPELPEDLDALLVKMLSKGPEERPADASEVMRALEQIALHEQSDALLVSTATSLMTTDESRLVSLVAILPAINSLEKDGATKQMPPLDVLEIVRRTVKPFKATVEPLAGVGVMAMFEGLGNAGDQVTIAARCALRIKELVPSEIVALYTGRSSRRDRLHVGELIDRTSELVHTTSEIGSMGRFGSGILIDDTTRSLLGDRFVIVEEGMQPLLRQERVQEDVGRMVLGKPIPCVGRERDLRSLLDFAEEGFEESSARAILVSASAGMGKSRLRLELMDRLQENGRDLFVISGRGDWLGVSSAFGLVGGALRAALNIESSLPHEEQRQQLLKAAEACGAGARVRVAAFLGEMLGVPFPDDDHPRLHAARQNASIMADGIQQAFVDFMRVKASASPVLLVLEDLHWGDTPSMRLVNAALRELGDLPLVVLGLGRLEVHDVFPGLWQGRMFHSLRLGRLSRKGAESLVRAILGDGVDPSRMDAIVERADGNALFIQELSRAVAEGHSEDLPDTIAGMVEARIMALPASSRLLLRAASIYGRRFRPEGIAALIDQALTSTSLSALLDELVNREFLARKPGSRLAANEELTFRQALIQQAAYAMLTDRDRTLGHKLAAEWLESNGEQDPMILAEHFARGGEPGRAVGHYLRAARQAFHGGDSHAARERAERGMASGATGETEAALWAIMADSFLSDGEYKRGIECADRALQKATLGTSTYCHALGCALGGALMTNNLEIIRRLGPSLNEFVPPSDAMGTASRAYAQAITLLVLHGATEEARGYLNRMAEVIGPACPADSYATAWWESAQAFWSRFVEKEPWRALVHDLASVAHLETVADRNLLTTARGHVGLDYLLLGAHGAAEAMLDRALADAPMGSMPWDLAAHCKSRLLLETRRLDDAQRLAAVIQSSAAERNSRVIGMNATLTIVEAKILQGDFEGAERDLGALGDPAKIALSFRPSILSLLGEIRLRQRRADEAVQLAEDARAACDAAGGTAGVRQDTLALLWAEALFASGRVTDAKEVMGRLIAELLARADAIGDSELRRSFLENVPTRARAFEEARAWGLEIPSLDRRTQRSIE
ncbi:MAG: protein kinase [Polyangiaceae bacterium]|nr:protein kinase [Polyangiaceae bacterium]